MYIYVYIQNIQYAYYIMAIYTSYYTQWTSLIYIIIFILIYIWVNNMCSGSVQLYYYNYNTKHNEYKYIKWMYTYLCIYTCIIYVYGISDEIANEND